ncbi:MBL fold metallo-hydrolase [Fusobacterium sp. HC1336]|uniref:MBL fold metallo-hydrolase n=1 Tax=Fusobacterium sp. HC1336 TaxID=3171169 RepID=UPI003F2139C7
MIITHENDIYLQFLGGASEVGATSVYVYWKGIKILIDSGKRQGSKTPYPIFDEIDKDIDIFILTHLHQDHIGSLMECYSFLNLKRIITSKANKETISAILKDSQKFSKNGDEELKEAYSDERIVEFIDKIEEYISPIKIKDLKIEFYETSHLIGSLGIFFESSDYSLLMTSDFTESKKFFHPKTTFIDKLKGKNIDTLITETTYGRNEDGDEVLKENCLNDLAYAINNIFDTNGNVLLPCFALGRMQEVLLALTKLIVSGAISQDTKIFINTTKNKEIGVYKSLGMQITAKYFKENFEEFKEEFPEKFCSYFKSLEKDKDEILDKIIDNQLLNIRRVGKDLKEEFKKEKNAIFIIQPGMLGNVNEQNESYQKNGKLALEIASGEVHGIIFVGYQAENTVGGVIKNSTFESEMIAYNQSHIRKNRNIYNVTFPGHVSIKGIKDLIENLNPKNVVLVHGDILASKNVAKSITDKTIFIPEIDEKLYLFDNGEKRFFSMQHKFSRIILDLENKYELLKDKSILFSPEYQDNILVKLLKSEAIELMQPKLLHFEFLINQKNEIFYKELQKELTKLGISSNIKMLIDIKNINDIVADLISDTNEKAKMYLLSYPFEILKDIITLGQMSEADIYIENNNSYEKILDFPYDINEEYNFEFTKVFGEFEERDDFEDLVKKLKYYRNSTTKFRKKVEERYSLRPEYHSESKLYKRNIFYVHDNSLWGDIENIYGITHKGVVADLEDIYSKLEEKIVSIEMTNYIFTYNQNKEYREILGVNQNYIYGKYYLENGIQFFTIQLRSKLDASKEISEIKLQVELLGGK